MAVTYTCGQCRGTQFPEGMFLYQCPACHTDIHPGCWDAHVAAHRQRKDIVSDDLTPRRGKISAYGIIQWDN
jgi:hypothetical protein